MAKLVVNLDTETGEFTATVNGVAVDNLQSVHCFCYEEPMEEGEGPEKECTFSIQTMKKEEGVNTFQTIYAKKTPQGQEAIRLGGKDSEIPECVIDVTKASRGDADEKLKQSVLKFLRQGL